MVIKTESVTMQPGKCILYWMQQAQRVHDNPALEYAIRLANVEQLPLIVLFVITDDFPEANLRHYTFMLQGLRETWSQLDKLNIACLIMIGDIVAVVTAAARFAFRLVMDMGYLNIQKEWRKAVIESLTIPYTQIETEPFISVESLMQKEAYNALSIRTRMYRLLPEHHLELVTASPVNNICPDILKQTILDRFDKESGTDRHTALFYLPGVQAVDLTDLQIDNTVYPVKQFTGGYSEAKKRLTYYQDYLLSKFQVSRGDPALEAQSDLSPYLHFGQISIRTVLSVLLEREGLSNTAFFHLVLNFKPGTHADNRINGLLELFEEGVIRRELSFNFCHFNQDYDSYAGLPHWARATLSDHSRDDKNYIYGMEAFEQAATHDEYWNAAQMEMLKTGKMHGYMRMYWGKKILEWSASPEDAFHTALYLNNKYELDGRDANAFAGVTWCFGKHDRPWAPRPVYGNVRSMTESGLLRKFDMTAYLNRIKQL